jgi:hypothetical protein
MGARVKAKTSPIALGKEKTSHLPDLPKERSQISTHETNQAHDNCTQLVLKGQTGVPVPEKLQ